MKGWIARGRLFHKYVAVLFLLVGGMLLLSSVVNLYFSYRQTKAALIRLQRQQALAVLGLPPNASRQQIKRRYRALAKKHHPDRGGDQREMKRIIAAYELLMKDQT